MSTFTVAECEVEGPLPWEPGLLLATYDLAAVGYVAEEFFLSGTAASFARATAGVESNDEAAYRTRIVVCRPLDPAAFHGTVVVEWLNVSGGSDGGPDWMMMHRHFIRAGMAWVGVTAQRVGVHGGGMMPGLPALRESNPERYGTLEHPGDAFSFDVFSQAGAAVRRGASGILGGAQAGRLLGVGESQSAMCLVTYVNDVDPLVEVFDGFVVHGRGPAGPGLSGNTGMSRDDGDPAPVDLDEQRRRRIEVAPEPMTSPRVPVITVQSETDVLLLGGIAARCEDGPNTRLWEIAGAAHFDTYGLGASFSDDGSLPIEELAALLAPTASPLGMQAEEMVNSGPQQHYVLHAALDHLERWVGGGDGPPHAPVLSTTGAGTDAAFEHDDHGNVLGGLRTPWVEVPTAALLGLGGAGGGFTILFGVTRPFDDSTLAELYPGGRDDYLAKFQASATSTCRAGFFLEEDLPEILALAAASWSTGSH